MFRGVTSLSSQSVTSVPTEGGNDADDGPIRGGPRLRRDLSIWAAIGISLALMAPSMAANINPQGSALSVGRAVPLAFVPATIGVLLVSYSFVRLCQRFHHAGSIYGFVGAILGPRAGIDRGMVAHRHLRLLRHRHWYGSRNLLRIVSR